jgi:hypothetical protein
VWNTVKKLLWFYYEILFYHYFKSICMRISSLPLNLNDMLTVARQMHYIELICIVNWFEARQRCKFDAKAALCAWLWPRAILITACISSVCVFLHMPENSAE